MKISKKSHKNIRIQNIIFYLVFVLIIGALGFISKQYSFESDWTFGNRNTLTEATQSLLKTLDQPLEFVAYIPDDATTQEPLKKLIGKYQRFKKDTTLEFVNPDLNPGRAQHDGIQYAGQMLVRMGERSEIIESTSEQEIASVLSRLSKDSERLIVFLEGHDERKPLGQENTGMSQLFSVVERTGFRVQPHNMLRSQSIPDNASFVVIASPQKDYLEGEVKILKEYIEKGGNLLWLHEPGSLHKLGELEEILSIKLHEGTVVDANQELQLMLGINHPAVIPVLDYGRSEITKSLSTQTLFPFATLVERDAENTGGWTFEEILTTLPQSWLETGDMTGRVQFDEDEGDKAGPISIGMSLTRKIEDKEQRVIVVGDSDFMLNSFIGQGANLDLSVNILNWLSKDDNMLNVKVQSAPDTKLDMPDALAYSLALFFLLGLPAILVTTGVIIWLKRRKR